MDTPWSGRKLLINAAIPGLSHACNDGAASWIVEALASDIRPRVRSLVIRNWKSAELLSLVGNSVTSLLRFVA